MADQGGSAIQKNHYYPFGMTFVESTDPLAEKYYSISPYVYVGNNPMFFTDPTGMDWFVNNKNGNLIYIKGISELNNDIANKYDLGNTKNYENFGADNMLGDRLEQGRFENLLDQEYVNFEGASRSENFMNKYGYEKAERLDIKEQFIQTKGDAADRIHTMNNYTLEIKSKTDITYVKPNDLNKKTDFSISYSYPQSFFSNMETVNYTITKPFGQDVNKTSYYRESKSVDGAIGVLQLIGSILSSIF